MKKVLILGANGSLAKVAIRRFLKDSNFELTLYLRNLAKLNDTPTGNAKIIEGDVLDSAALSEAMRGQDIVYANLAGKMEAQAKNIVRVMNESGIKRLIFISSMGIYGEVPGEKYTRILDPYRRSADVIEVSDLDYTILRPGWFTSGPEIDFQITTKGEAFKGHNVSRASVADLISKLCSNPDLHVRESLGVASVR